MRRSLSGAVIGAVIFAFLVNISFAQSRADPGVPPQNIAQALQLTREILSHYRLASPPDLNLYGLQLGPDGAYMKNAEDGTAVWASRGELAKAVEQSLLDSYDHMAREDADRWLSAELRARLPQEEGIGALDTSAKALILQCLIDNPDAKIKGTLALFSSRLNQAKEGAAAAEILDEMFVGAKASQPVELENLIRNPTGLRLSPSSQEALRNAADMCSSCRPVEFKPPGAPSLKIAAPPSVIITNLRTVSIEELYFLLGELKDRDQADIPRLREELLRLANFEDSHVRERSVYFLGMLRDESLAPFFEEKLRDQEGSVRDYAARAMGIILGSIHLKEGWPGFIKKVPGILSAMALGKDQNPFTENGDVVRIFMSDVNLLEEKQKKEFIAGFNKPAAIAIILAMSRGEDVNEHGGLHTPEGRQLYFRLKELAAGLGLSLSRILDDPAVNPDTRARFLVRANRYQVLEDAVRADPALLGLAIANLFTHYFPVVEGDAIFSACQAIENVYHGRFYDAALKQLSSLPLQTQARVIIYLKMRENNMRPDQRELLEAGVLRIMPKDFFPQVSDDDIAPPYYKAWPKDVLNVALFMTQEGWARDFENAARADGYRLAANNPKDFQRQGRCLAKKVSQKEIRIFLTTLPSTSEGWVLDNGELNRILNQSFGNDKFQVIVYRGHAREVIVSDLLDAKNKVFIDLSCESSFEQEYVIKRCQDCGFYGTLTTAQGVVNNRFLLLVLDGLARAETHRQTRQRLAHKLPANNYKFSGTWSPGTQFQIYCDAYDRLSGNL